MSRKTWSLGKLRFLSIDLFIPKYYINQKQQSQIQVKITLK